MECYVRSCGDQDSLSTFTEPRSPPEDIINVGVRFLLKLYGAVRSTSLDKLRYILYTRSVSRSSLTSRFKLESLPPTAAAAKFHSHRAYIAVQQLLAEPKQRWGDGATLTTHSQSTATVVNRKQWPTSSAAGYLMSLARRKTSPSSQRGQHLVWRTREKRSATMVWEQFVPNWLGLEIKGREFSPTHYRSASSAYTCVANRVVRLQDRLSEDMRMPEGRVVLFTHVQLLQWTHMQQHPCASRQSSFRQWPIEVWMR